MFTRVLALACLTWAGCSDHTSAIGPDACGDCDMAGAGTGGVGGGGGSCSGCGDMAGVVPDGGLTCGDDPACGFAVSAYRRGRGANLVLAARLDSDVYGDLIVSHNYDISIRLGRADGSYAPETVLDAGPYPHTFALGDFDGNGRPDIAVTSGNAKQVAVVLSVGDGVYKVERTMPVDGTPVGVAAGDLDGNGRADIVVLTQSPDQLMVFLDMGAGAFAPAQKLALAKTENALAIVDFDKDGKLDVVAAGPEAQIFVGKGNGTFQPEVRATSPIRADLLTVGDFNKDGALDLAVSGNYPAAGGGVEGEVAILLGNGTGGIASSTHVAFGLPPVSAIAAGDFDGDTKLDLAAARDGGDSLGIAKGNGDGTLGAFTVQPHDLDSGENVALTGMSALDLDNDGKLDLAVTSLSGWVGTLAGRGDGAFDVRWYGNVAYSGIAVGDTDGDGKRDLVISSWHPTLTSILRGDGQGTFAAAVDERVLKGAMRMASGDFDGDGKADVVTGSAKGLSVRWGRDGIWTTPASLAAISPASLAAGDMNGDGLDDLVVGGTGDITVFVGAADHTLTAKAAYGIGSNRAVTPIAVADFDGDKIRDVAAGTVGAPGVSVVLGTGTGTFNKLLASVSDVAPSDLASGDYDGDGRLDLVVAIQPTTVQLLVGGGDGTFVKGAAFATQSRAFLVLAGDFNGDGKRDLVVARGGDFNASLDLWLGDGAGKLTPFRQYPRMYLPLNGTVGDLDGDGKLDLAVVDYDGATIFLNRLR